MSSIIIAVVMNYVQKLELNYFSPVCIVSSIALFNLFVLIKPTRYKIINYLSSTVFGIFIVHGYFIYQIKKIIPIEAIVNLSMLPRLCGILLFVLIVFIISILISIILNVIVDRIFMSRLARIKSLLYEVK